MTTTSLMLMVASLLAPTETATYWVTPKFAIGQEVEYQGTILEKTVGSGVSYENVLELRSSALVLSMDPKRNAEIGSYTVYSHADREEALEGAAAPATSYHFALLSVAPNGDATWRPSGAAIALPPDGRVPWELGFLFQGPQKPLAVGDTWVIQPTGDPVIRGRVLGTDKIQSVACVKVALSQESDNWSAAAPATLAWRNETIVWLDTKDGIVQRLERIYELKESGSSTPTRRLETKYSLASSVRYHGPILTERMANFRTAHKLQIDLDKAIARPETMSKPRWDAMKRELESANKASNGSPYLAATTLMKQRIDLAAAGKLQTSSSRSRSRSLTGAVGQRAKAFTVRPIDSAKAVTLKDVAGNPALLVYVDPESGLTDTLIREALASVRAAGGDAVRVFVVSKRVESEFLDKLKPADPAVYTLCTGASLDRPGDSNGWPLTIFIDGGGYVRARMVGLGPEYAAELTKTIASHGKAIQKITRAPKSRPTYLR